jgi:hypothetical protein
MHLFFVDRSCSFDDNEMIFVVPTVVDAVIDVVSVLLNITLSKYLNDTDNC